MANPFEYVEGLLRQLIEPVYKIINAITEITELLDITSRRRDRLLHIQNILLSTLVNSFPVYHQGMNITPVVQEITRNVSAKYIAVRIYNNDVAQPLWYGKDNLTLANGEMLPWGQTMVRILAPGDVIYGMCTVGTVNIRVAVLENLYAELDKLTDEQILGS